jgi:molecular chaperone Hsp33
MTELIYTQKKDYILPFRLENTDIFGRFVSLDDTIDGMLKKHDYPYQVSKLLAEASAVASLMSTALKFDGLFTLQIQSQGPIKLLVADVTTDGKIRGYASFDETEILHSKGEHCLDEFMENGLLAFTVDQGENTEKYQGIVELKASTLVDSLLHYFQQSEQIKSGLMIFADNSKGKWIARGIFLQELPTSKELTPEKRKDQWQNSMMLLSTLSQDELLYLDTGADEILYRLFHEEGVRVFSPKSITMECRCSRDKIFSMIKNLPNDDRNELLKQKAIKITCEFCSTDYSFTKEDFKDDD